jgi:hypothetical protein
MSEERHDADSDSDRDSGNDEPNENVADSGAAADRASKRDPSPGMGFSESPFGLKSFWGNFFYPSIVAKTFIQ